MGKKIFWIFILAITAAISGTMIYVQSQSFARLVKRKVGKELAQTVGLEVNFTRLQMHAIPPGFSLLNTEVKVINKKNILGLPTSAVMRSQRVGVSFRLFQGISRGLTINKFFLSGATVDLDLSETKSQTNNSNFKASEFINKPIKIPLGTELFLLIRQLELRDTLVKIKLKNQRVNFDKIKYLSVTPNAPLTNVVANIENFEYEENDKKQKIEAFSGNIDLTEKDINIYSLDVQRGEVAAHAEGKLQGTVDAIDRLRGSARLIVRATSNGLGEFFPDIKKTQAQWSAELKLSGDLKKYTVDGALKITDFKYGLWEIDSVEMRGAYSGDKAEINSLQVKSGQGGFSLEPITLNLPFAGFNKKLRLTLNKFELEKFAGDLRKDINNLGARISGTIDADVTISKIKDKIKLTGLEIRPDFEIEQFEFNNQVWGKIRPKKNIFSLHDIKTSGLLRLKDGSFEIANLRLGFKTGTLNALGKIASDGKIDIKGNSEKVDLGAEAGSIAEIPLQGVGAFGIHVRGDSKDLFIDFQLGTKDSKYVNLQLGDLNGSLTLDDTASMLYIKNVQAVKGQSRYVVNGKVSVGGPSDLLEIGADFHDSTPEDMFNIFQHQLKDISWLPRGMTGIFNGKARIFGAYTDIERTMNVDADVEARDLSYLGEHVQWLNTNAGISSGTYFVKNLRAKKYNSNITGELAYPPSKKMKYRLNMDGGKLRDFDYFLRFDMPIEAGLDIRSAGEGIFDIIRSNTDISITNAHVYSRAIPEIKFNIATNEGRIESQGSLGAWNTRYQLSMGNRGEGSRLLVDFPAANYAFLLCLFNKGLCGDPGLEWGFSGSLKMNWLGKNWERANGSGEIKGFTIAKSDYRLRAADNFTVNMNDGEFRLRDTQILGDGTKMVLSASGKADLTELSARSNGIADMQVLEFLTNLIEESKGVMRINSGFTGSKDDIDLFGDLHMTNGFIRVNGLDAPAESLNGNIHLQNNRATVTGIDGILGGGTVSASGYVDLYLNQLPSFNVALNLNNNRVKFFPVNLAEFENARLTFTGNKPPYLFSGTAKARKILMRKNFDIGDSSKRRTSKYLPEKISGDKGFYEVKIKATADNNIIVQNDLLDAEFRGEVTLLNNFEFPQIIGRGELVKGKLLFRNAVFSLDHAVVRLNNPEIFEPQFSIGGQANVDAYKISIFASGTTDSNKITLSSNPSLPQEDILSLLAFGIRGDDAKRVSPDDLTAITYTEVGSILLEQLKINKDLQSKGFKLSVTPHVSDNEANIIRPRSVSEVASPKVLVQKRVFSNLDATLGSTFGSAQTQDLDASLEYHFNKRVSIDGVYEQKQTLEAAEKDSSYGADLKFKWGFK